MTRRLVPCSSPAVLSSATDKPPRFWGASAPVASYEATAGRGTCRDPPRVRSLRRASRPQPEDPPTRALPARHVEAVAAVNDDAGAHPVGEGVWVQVDKFPPFG